MVPSRVAAIVLAAGRSRRMGTQKLLLPWAGQTVIATVVDRVLGSAIDQVVVVVSADREAIAHALAGRRVTLVQNPDPESEMLSSVRCGVQALPADCDAALVALGDQPLLRTELVSLLIDARQRSGRGMVVPVCGGKRGHPLLISSRYFEEVLQGYDGTGLCGLLDAHANDVQETPTDDPTILDDLDTPDDYQRALTQAARESAGSAG